MFKQRLAGAGAVALASTVAVAATAAAAGTPAVSAISTKQSGDMVTVTVKTKNFAIDAKDVGKTPKAGKGHEHFQMDGGKYDYPKYSGANGKLAQQLGVQGKYSPSVNDKVTYKGLKKGTHKVTVFLVKNDHSNYKGASKTITFTVE